MTVEREFKFCSAELEAQLIGTGQWHHIPKGATIVSPKESMPGAMLLAHGTVKLYREFEFEERHLLYLLEGSCPCALSMLCVLLDQASPVSAIAEADSRLLVIPQEVVRELFVSNEEWRDLVLRQIMDAWLGTMSMLDEVAFWPLEQRLESYLSSHAKLTPNLLVRKSHAEIALDLNASREAVSRCLKKMENEDKVHLGHGSVKVLALP